MEAGAASVLLGICFAAGYIGYAIWFEASIMPGLPAGQGPTNGQQVGVAWLLVSGLGSIVGIGFAIARYFSLFWGAMLPAVCSFGLALLSNGHWQDSIARYGHNPSVWIVDVPPLCISIAVHFVSLLVAIAATMKRNAARRKTSLRDQPTNE